MVNVARLRNPFFKVVENKKKKLDSALHNLLFLFFLFSVERICSSMFVH